MRLKCPKQESLFEYISIPREISLWKRLAIRLHTASCRNCQERMSTIKTKWDAYFTPEPELASSLIRVYSRLQNDETLILKGWKLSEQRPQSSLRRRLFAEGWLFRGAVSLSLGSLLLLFVVTQVRSMRDMTSPENVAQSSNVSTNENIPFAQIRIEDKNRIQVHYVRPELLQSMEFETVSATR